MNLKIFLVYLYSAAALLRLSQNKLNEMQPDFAKNEFASMIESAPVTNALYDVTILR